METFIFSDSCGNYWTMDDMFEVGDIILQVEELDIFNFDEE